MSRPTSPRAASWCPSRSRCRPTPASTWCRRKGAPTRQNSRRSGNGSPVRRRTNPERATKGFGRWGAICAPSRVLRLVAPITRGKVNKTAGRQASAPGCFKGGLKLQDVNSSAPVSQAGTKSFWPERWWAIVDYKIGIIPLPIFLLLFVVIGAFALTGKVPSDILMAIVLLSMGGFTCAELGKRIPIIRNIGAAAIFATFIPSALVYYHLLPAPIVDSVQA